ITFLDEMIGQVLDYLKIAGLRENTLILFTADHGDLLGDFGTVFKGNHQNASVRVPFIISGPGVVKGKLSEALVGLQDILPTFAEIAGVQLSQPTQGISLLPILKAPKMKVREFFYSSTATSYGNTLMVTDGVWKYIYTEAGGVEELYRQPEDKAEVNNLARQPGYASQVKWWRNKLRECAREFQDEDVFFGEDLRKKEVDRESFSRIPVSGMGWRWY
ncbi:MAG: sulfatase-like hydrolase/transferase, partial [Candidatus Omnitrophica bacterium]|nr:sulfatase-like hydrolase/transferase [Candidatus Omnitrophota bacterium]